jgi:NAD(P)-dependent dehydrogenase (short-subunit alcohol dehydrogenase family)
MSDSLFSVDGQVVLVSGGTRGIGRALAEGFCERGATVVVTGREPAVAEQAAGEIAAKTKGQCFGLGCDVAQKAQIDKCVAEIVAKHGRIDTLVNVAGVNRRKPAADVTEEDWDFIIDTNLRGAFFMSQAVGKQMVAQKGGSQIQICSLNNYGPLPWVLPYAASKAAVGHMTRVLAMEWGSHGVRVNAIAPGYILTDLSKKLWSNPMMQEWNTANTPLRRLGQPDDMNGAAIFLASKASSFMTGQIVFVDGGFSAGIMWPIDKAT